MNKGNIDLLVHKKVTNQITTEEALQLEQLVSSDTACKTEADNVAYVWNATAIIDDNIQFDSKRAFNKFLENTQIHRHVDPVKDSRVFTLQRIMAVAAMFALAFFAFNFLTKTHSTDIESGSTSIIAYLPEGSEVKLAPNSSISYDKSSFGTIRKITLNGSGIIHVSKTGVPFIVKGSNFEVEVMGTTFYVESDGGNENVRVLEGKVEVRNKNTKVQITDKQGVSIKNNILTKADNVDFADLGWQNDNMEYNNTPLAKVLADIEAKFSIIITLKSTEAIRNCTFTSGSIAKLPLDQIILIMESTYNTKFLKKTNKEYALSSINCK
jgi:ferric-dicitrate binding protein FerR (iron transport regulator)